MELEEQYDEFLLEIYHSEQQSLPRSALLAKEITARNRIQVLLDDLIEMELIELDSNDDTYYLTYEGYEYVEALISYNKLLKNRASQASERRQRQGVQNNFWRIILGLCLFCLGYFAIKGISVEEDVIKSLDQETLKKMQQEVSDKVDSILQAREQLNYLESEKVDSTTSN